MAQRWAMPLAMTFQEQLTQLVEHATQAGKERIATRLESYTNTVIASLREDWDDFELAELTSDAEEAGEGAMWLDAAECVRNQVLDGKAAFADVSLLKSTARDVASEVEQLFASKTLPGKGLVYVLWSEAPEHYAYVGRVSGPKKLKFSGKGPLARALESADTLSLLVPVKGGEANLSSISSSIIHLSRCQTEADPEFNDDVDADMPDSDAWKPIVALSDLLEHAGVHLNNRAKTGED